MSLLSSSSSSPSSFAFPPSSVSAAEELPLAHGFPSHPIHLHSLKNDLPFADDLLSNDYSEEEQFTPLFPPLPSSMGMAYPRFPQSFKDNAAFAFPRLPLPPATSQPRFSQSSIPSSTKCEVYTHPQPQSSSSSQVLPNQKPVKRVGGAEPRRGSRSHPPLPSFYVSQPTRTPSPNKARFVSPLSIEPQQKHLTRRKVEESNLCSFPESMVIPSSSNGHCYMVEDLFPSPHVSQEEFEEESESFEELFSDSSRIGASTFSSESDESDSTDPIFSTSPSLHPSTGSPIERLHRLEKLF